MKFRLFVAVLAAGYLGSGEYVQADPLPEPLESQRQVAIDLAGRACLAEAGAYQHLQTLSLHDDLPAAHAIAWLVGNEACPTYGLVPEGALRHHVAAEMEQQVAARGYPIAQAGYGHNLMRGSNGIERDPEAGKDMLMAAVSGGYALAAVILAEDIAHIGPLPLHEQEFVTKLLTFAEQQGIAVDRVTLGRARVAEARYGVSGDLQELLTAIRLYTSVAATSDIAKTRAMVLTGMLQDTRGMTVEEAQARVQADLQAPLDDIAATHEIGLTE